MVEESRPSRGKWPFIRLAIFFTLLSVILALLFLPVWKCPPCNGDGKGTIHSRKQLVCPVCEGRGRAGLVRIMNRSMLSLERYQVPR
jgi:hypothetical protein